MNLLEDLPSPAAAEEIQQLLFHAGVRIERIVSHGQASPEGFWYDQGEHEWVVVLRGWGVVEFADGRQVRLQAGDTLVLPAGIRHRVSATCESEPTVWLAVFWPAEKVAPGSTTPGAGGASPV